MGLFDLFKKKDAAYFQGLSAKEFFTDPVYGGKDTSPYASEEFHALPLDTRREILAGKFGLTWAEYSKIPGYAAVEMVQAAAGNDTYAVAGRVADAAAQDARAAKFSGFLAGIKLNVGLIMILLIAAAGAIMIYRRPLMALVKKVKAA